MAAVIRGKNDKDLDGFWILKVHQTMAFFDEKQTEYGWISESAGGSWEDIEKIVLDKDKITSVPLDL